MSDENKNVEYLRQMAAEAFSPTDREILTEAADALAKLSRDRQAMSECLYHIIREEFENGTEGDRMRQMAKNARTCFELIQWMDKEAGQ